MNRGSGNSTLQSKYGTSAPLLERQTDRARTSLSLRSLGPDPRILTLEPGPVDITHLAGYPDESFGILVLDGLILARLESGRAHAGWLIGAEDLLRPWEMPEISLTREVHWQALMPSRVMRINRSFWPRLQHDAGFVQELLAGAARTSHWLFAKSLVISAPSIEDRLVLLFALWGERWGKVTAEGIWIDLPLTHDMIAELCGARRPTVTVSLRALEEQGILTRLSRSGWLLRRASEVNGRHGCWPQYAAALGFALGEGETPENGP